jgi:hypothetical protein
VEKLIEGEKKLGDKVAAELVTGVKLTQIEAASIASLLEQRERAVAHLKENHYVFSDASGLQLTPQGMAGLTKIRKSQFYADEILGVQEKLVPHVPTVDRAVTALAQIGEEQYLTSEGVAEKKPKLGPALEAAGASEGTDLAEISASLAVLARPRCCTILATAHLVDRVLRVKDRSTLIALVELERELGAPVADKWWEDGIDVDGVGQIVIAVADHGAEEIRAAAERAHQRLFGAPPPPYVRTIVP